MKPLTPRELGDAIGVSESTVRAMYRRGDLPEAHRVGPKLIRIHPSAVQRLAPQPVTLDPEWQDAEDQQSERTNAAPASGASSGVSTGGNARNAASLPKTKRKTTRTRSVSAFARDFPEYVKHERSAS